MALKDAIKTCCNLAGIVSPSFSSSLSFFSHSLLHRADLLWANISANKISLLEDQSLYSLEMNSIYYHALRLN